MTTITFIGAGSTVFTRNIAGDILNREALSGATIRLMDIDPKRLAESEAVVGRMVRILDVPAKVETHADQRAALDGADFVVVCFQIGGYDPCTITDFEVPKRFGLRQTIADTLGIGGIMRGLRTVPHLWSICEDMLEVCPQAIMLQYVNPMAINTWAIGAKYPAIAQVGLCHSVQGTAAELAADLDVPVDELRYRAAGINHMAFYLNFERRMPDGTHVDLYPELKRGHAEGRFPKGPNHNPRCPNKVRYEMLSRLGYFVTESSEHFAEYTPYFIKRDRPDLIERYGVPLDEYPKRCVEQIARWDKEAARLAGDNELSVRPSREYAATIMNAVRTGEPAVIYGNIPNAGLHSAAARRLRRRGAGDGGRERASADRRAGHPAAADRADAHQRQRPGPDGGGADERRPLAHLSRRDARPAHRRRARSRPDLVAGRRASGGA